MKERGILFSAPMVRRLLSGDKTQTRRIRKLGVRNENDPSPSCPYGSVGDRLWIRETYALLIDPTAKETWELQIPDERPTPERTQLGHVPTPIYRADGDRPDVKSGAIHGGKMSWRPGIYMPRWASRITLEIAGIKVERVQEISEEDARAEGMEDYLYQCYDFDYSYMSPEVSNFRRLWSEINGAESWEQNPFVWAISFKLFEEPARRAGKGVG